MKRRIPLAPAEGWLTLGLVLLICVTMAWAIDNARWVLGRDSYLDDLPFAAIGGVLVGFIGAKVGWGRWLTYLIGAIFAALIVPLLVGSIMYERGGSLHDLYQTAAGAAVQAYIDIAIYGQSATSQYLHYVLVLGMLVWATSLFASYAVFGHRRPLNAVVLVGVVLVANMSITVNDQLPHLILFSLASLFLLIRAHVFDEQSEWMRRRIGDPATISTVYLRGGTMFIVLAVLGSYVLTQTAASKPLAGAWDGVGQSLVSLTRSFSRFLPTGGANRSFGVSFGPNATVQQQWNFNGGIAVTIQLPPGDDGKGYYWRAFAYDRIDLASWGISDTVSVQVAANAPLFDKLADAPATIGTRKVQFTVTPGEYKDPTVLSPLTPDTVAEPSKMSVVGPDGYYATVERDDGGKPYVVDAVVPVLGDDPGQLNNEALRVAGTVYPDTILARYLGIAPNAMGPDALALEASVKARADGSTPLDWANEFVKELHSDTYHYDTDVTGIDCADLGTVECFARFKHGFCQYYAITMAVILRDMGVPTRLVQGFLPSEADGKTGTVVIHNSNAHAWVEVYFPTYGWVMFDPTGGGVAQAVPLPTGHPGPSSAAGPVGSFVAPSRRLPPEGDGRDNPAGGTGTTRVRVSIGPLIGIGALLLLIVGLLAFVAWQRGPRGPTSPDGAYGTVTRLASRFGFGPRPTQTVYEFTGSLSDVLPASRPELETVARAKVESVYAREILGEDRMASLRAAQRRLRVSLLRLALRRKERRRRRR
jgi:transglutaminase-like putative cysteine protease